MYEYKYLSQLTAWRCTNQVTRESGRVKCSVRGKTFKTRSSMVAHTSTQSKVPIPTSTIIAT